MTNQDERKKVLDLLEAGRVSADQASDLLRALGSAPRIEPPPVPAPPHRVGTARVLRISIDAAGDEGDRSRAKVRVNVPLGLAKFATRFLPQEAKRELESQGIDLSELITAISTETPEGRLVDIDVDDDDEGASPGRKKAKIVVEVV
jgi:hypothetical protein